MATNSPPEKKELDFFDSGSEYTRRKRIVFTEEQLHILEFYFQNNQYPGIDERKKLSKLINVPEDSLRVWFQNRRAKVAAHTHKKRLAFKTSTSLRSKCPEDVSRDPSLEEDFSEQKFSTPSKSTCPFWAGDSSQELDPRSGCSFERSTMCSTTEAAYLYGYGLSQSHPSVSSQTMGSSIDLQSCALSRPMSHGSSNQWTSSLALQGTAMCPSETFGWTAS
ncbi:homeobox protein OTX2-B-like isoform X2 [Antechinus flavipes]|uniref:homeobox protein OTX2-B-like isoform X2 n=1 Tax=Antechinus flavipes TaxID=38775 RepID=UPI002235707E|nr:homeobox protein OTX2-B-like isoform X2 [Antechinus flavipes]